MSKEIAAFFTEWQAERHKMKEQAPDIASAFGSLHQSLMKDGALSHREKELIALAIGVASYCSPCIMLHVQGCLKAGASRAQIIEAAGVGVMMRGGPAFTHVPEVLGALEHLESQ